MKRDQFVKVLDIQGRLRGQTVLELGCGDGYFTKQLAKYAKSVHAVDGRIEQIKATQEACKKYPNVSYLVSDVEKEFFDLPLRPFDMVFHVGLLYHLNDPVRHINLACNMAKEVLFLDTHYAAWQDCLSHYNVDGMNVQCQVKTENTSELREGLRAKSRWLLNSDIRTLLQRHFRRVENIYERRERNGMRVTFLATQKYTTPVEL